MGVVLIIWYFFSDDDNCIFLFMFVTLFLLCLQPGSFMKKSYLLKSTACFVLISWGFFLQVAKAQSTQIRGFVDVNASYADDKVSFALGEQDLFITSEISDRINFLGESVFKYSATSPTLFDVSMERVVIKYNYAGNHNLLVGKHHTPVNYWNDTYHHGRVFFPTIFRPLLFSENIIPLHTTGISLSGHDLGKLKFGYDFMVGNGIGSGDLNDNDKFKSFTGALHLKPLKNFRIGGSYYYDMISKGAKKPHSTELVSSGITQQLISGSLSYFGRSAEFLIEGTFASNKSDSTGTANNIAAYGYAGIRLFEKWVPYIRYDYLNFDKNEIYFHNDNTTSFIGGIRFEINYLAVVKIEFQHTHYEMMDDTDTMTAQFAIGF